MEQHTDTKDALPPGLLRRLGAILYDGLLLVAVLFATTALVLPVNDGKAFEPEQSIYPLYLLGVTFLFYGWFWTHGGQTLGMRAWRIRVICESGGNLTWARAWARFIAAILSWSAAGFGFWWIAISRKKNGWHDSMSKTRVVWVASENKASD
ncbi:MAG: RDD family protein [Pseudomonadota bacterium]|nr:RDD family protein [Pseudomonadota bacterium]